MTNRMVGAMTAAYPELARALSKDNARFLDVGVGGAGGAIALCKHFPNLRILGLDVLRAAHLEARAAVTQAGLQHRIELRLKSATELTDENTFEAAFIASKFFPRDVLAASLVTVKRALVPGGF